jgi:hypothetical protein
VLQYNYEKFDLFSIQFPRKPSIQLLYCRAKSEAADSSHGDERRCCSSAEQDKLVNFASLQDNLTSEVCADSPAFEGFSNYTAAVAPEEIFCVQQMNGVVVHFLDRNCFFLHASYSNETAATSS